MVISICFRGKSINTNEWIYGDLIHYDENNFCIIEQKQKRRDIQRDAEKVIPKTIGQFTGMYDKNDKKIFCHDIVKDRLGNVYEVIYVESKGMFAFMPNYSCSYMIIGVEGTSRDLEIIGNMFDNPKLYYEGGRTW